MPSARALARMQSLDPDAHWDPERIAASLPIPEYPYPDRTKKSHARKQAPGHIPRPRNPFILFRTNFVRQQRIPNSVESDHRNISRIVGRLWNVMTNEQKQPWKQMAVFEREEHAKIHPGYRFTPGNSGGRKKKAKRGDVDVEAEVEHPSHKIESPQYHRLHDNEYSPPRRPSSCPPGAPHVPQLHLESFRTRDDSARRPSKIITFYQSYDSPRHPGYSSLPAEAQNHQYHPAPTGPLEQPEDELGYPHTQQYGDHRFDPHVGPYMSHIGYGPGTLDRQYGDNPWGAYEPSHSSSTLLRPHDETLPAALRSPPMFIDPFSNPITSGFEDHRYDHASTLVMQQIMRFDDPIVSPKTTSTNFDIGRKSSHFPGRTLPKPVTNGKQKRESADLHGNPWSLERPWRASAKSFSSMFIDFSGGSPTRSTQTHLNGIGSTSYGHDYVPDVSALPRLTRDTANSPTDSTLSPHTASSASP